MKNLLLFIFAFTCFIFSSYGQPVSAISPIIRDSIFTIIKDKKGKETIPLFLQYYDQIDSSTNLLRIPWGKVYNLYGFDYSKNLFDYVIFDELEGIYLIKTINGKNSIICEMLTGLFYGELVISVYNEDLASLITKVDIKKVLIFVIQGSPHLFVYANNKVYIYVDNEILDANTYLQSKYTLKELDLIFNRRYR